MNKYFWVKLIATATLSGSIIIGTVGLGAWTKPSSIDNNINFQQALALSDNVIERHYHQPQGLPLTSSVTSAAANNNQVYVGTYWHGLYISTDVGKTFTKVPSIPTSEANIKNITIHNNWVYVGTWKNGLRIRSHIDQNFTQALGIPTNASINNVTIHNNQVYVGTQNNGLYISSGDGEGFQPVSSIPNNVSITSVAFHNKRVYVGTYGKGLYIGSSSDDNFTCVSGIPIGTFVYNITINNDQVYVGTIKHGLYIRSHTDQSFIQAPNIPNGADIYNVTVNNNKVYVGIYYNGIYGLYWSDNCGQSFTKSSNIPTSAFITNLTANNDQVYAGTNKHGLYVSTTKDTGETFTRAIGIPDDASIRNVTVHNNQMYVGTEKNGLYVSLDDGNTFIQASDVPVDGEIEHVVINKTTNQIYVGTYGSGDGFWIGDPLANALFTTTNQPFLVPSFKNDYQGWVFNQPQWVETSDTYLKSATIDDLELPTPTGFVLDDKKPTTPGIEEPQHILTLTLKDQYKQFAPLFGGDPATGEINFLIWIKKDIKNIKYLVPFGVYLDDQKVGKGGNVDGYPVIMTRRTDGYIQFPAPLTIAVGNNEQKIIDYSKSYYVAGTVNLDTNDFSATGDKQPLSIKTLIDKDGIYQIVYTDYVGNQYIAYAELGKDNHKLITKDA